MEMETTYALALGQTRLSSTVLYRLVLDMGSAEAVWNAPESLLKTHLKGEVLAEQRLAKFRMARQAIEPEQLAESYTAMGIQILTLWDSHYPQLLGQIHDPPFVLYVRGNIEALGERPLAMVGTRRYTDTGKRVVETFVEQLEAYKPCIVSGLAEGIDTLSHQEALRHGLPTVAVFGTGIDKIFPKRNESLAQWILEAGGALVSEYPLGVSGDKYTFPQRNRIIAGLSLGTLVVEGDIKSGSLITARCALKENREVMAVPGSVFNPMARGPNTLIQQGATLVQHGEDIAECLGWKNPSPPKSLLRPVAAEELAHLSEPEKQVFEVIGYEPTSFDAIHDRNRAVTVMDITTALTMLELYGLVRALPGSRYCRNGDVSVVQQGARSNGYDEKPDSH